MVIDDNGEPRILRGMKVSELDETVPLFRRVANLYEILTYNYWSVNYGHRMDATAARHMAEYLSERAGEDHIEQLLRKKLASAGRSAEEIDAMFTPRPRCRPSMNSAVPSSEADTTSSLPGTTTCRARPAATRSSAPGS